MVSTEEAWCPKGRPSRESERNERMNTNTSTPLAEAVKKATKEVVEKIPNFECESKGSYIWERLGTLGITPDDTESHKLIAEGFCREGDARHVFCEGLPPAMPVPWFRKMWSMFMGSIQVAESNQDQDGDS